EPAPPPPRVEASGECGAGRVQDRVGREYSESLGESIRDESGAASVRVIRPGEAVTLDYRADRLNVRLDDDDIIAEIGCG
ncbi:I78 family peptidase inhibitor, partial [Halomonas sp. BM-2019]|uniref:I78 family peptidase inhibitor n=1 Tax=Halomonas sp. BM-2019 TaxID=2811227 RepID=UPI001B3C2284